MQQKFFDKKEARKYLSELRNSLTESQRKEKSEKICDRIIASDEFSRCRLLLVYYPIKSEVNILPLIQKAFELGKEIAFPISKKSSYQLDFRKVNSLQELSVGAYGICEPYESAPLPALTIKKEEALCIVPALALDKNGGRLGYGKGFYDRFLAENKSLKICLCFSDLIESIIPTDNHDILMDAVITEEGFFSCRNSFSPSSISSTSASALMMVRGVFIS